MTCARSHGSIVHSRVELEDNKELIEQLEQEKEQLQRKVSKLEQELKTQQSELETAGTQVTDLQDRIRQVIGKDKY